MSASRKGCDCIVVGAGVIGLSVAYELLRRGMRVLLLDGNEPGSGASRVAGGMLAPTSEAELAQPALVRLGVDSRDRYRGFVRDLEVLTGMRCEYRTEGTLWVALNRDDEGDLERLREIVAAKGLSADLLSPAQVLEREPQITARLTSGVLISGDHQVDPRALTRVLQGAIRRLGGQVEAGVKVCEVVSEGGRVCGVVTHRADGTVVRLDASSVVLCAGAWSTEGLLSPLAQVARVRPVKGQIVRLRGPQLLRHVVRAPRVYLIPRHDGTLLLGATTEEVGFDGAPTCGAVLDLLGHAWRVLPGVADLELVDVGVGFRPALQDHLPIIGDTPVPGFFVATGHYRDGVLLAPATAHYLAEMVVNGTAQSALTPFSWRRFCRNGEPR